jgi:hypothetical protein
MSRGDDPEQARLGGQRYRLEASADRKRLLSQLEGIRPLVEVGERSLGAHALRQHHPVIDRLEVSVSLRKEALRSLRLAHLDVGHGDEVPDAAQSMG